MERGTDELLALYVGMLQMDSAPFRRVAVWELGRLGDPRGAEALMQAVLTDADWECRHYAVMALANVGGPAEAAELEALIGNGYLGDASLPAALAAHVCEDLEYSARCCAGDLPRPAEDEGRHGEWWRGGS
jgi:HEAT repeat protein